MLVIHDETPYLRSPLNKRDLLPLVFSTGCLGLGSKARLVPEVQEKAFGFSRELEQAEPGLGESPETRECSSLHGAGVCGLCLLPVGCEKE